MEEMTIDERTEILDRVQQKAISYQFEYRGCAQPVFYALQEEFQLSESTDAFKAASFLGCGIVREMDICGALTGGIMAIGLADGRESFYEPLYPEEQDIDPASGLAKSIVKIREFYQKFAGKYGGTTCRALQKNTYDRVYNLADAKECLEFAQIHGEDCAEVAGQVARWAAEVIIDIARLEYVDCRFTLLHKIELVV
jgi:C_GCAxxG_C_C family probable redox protein